MIRAFSSVCVVVLLAAIAPAATASSGLRPAGDVSTPAAVGTGGVAINGDAAATADAGVTLTIPPPVSSLGMLRVSNDGGAASVELPWATALSWSLIDPAAGGVDADGPKTVTVDAGDGLGSWSPLGSASILLDRTGPVVSSANLDFSGGPVGRLMVDASDAGVGIDRTEISLDGIHWRVSDPHPWTFWPSGMFDVREGMIGGTYGLGTRTLSARVFDQLGNVTSVPDLPLAVTSDRTQNDPPMDFVMPLPAVTGHDFTIAPVFDKTYRVPAGKKCSWSLVWGDEQVRLEAGRDATYGEVRTTVAPVNGICKPWTFTLPYTSVLEYSWRFAIVGLYDAEDYNTEPFVGAFRATQDSTYRGIADSNLPLYTVVPDRDYVGIDGTVTYRVFARGGAPARSGWWGCGPADNTPSDAGQTQTGGSSFVCHVTTSEAWAADWGWSTPDSSLRYYAGYDPVGDRSRPVMRSLRVTVEPGTVAAMTEVAKLTWRASDKGTGVRAYTVQVSRNGGAWATIALPSKRSVTLTRSLAIGSTYRFRARATDRAGNTGTWLYTPTVRPTRYDDRSAKVRWSAGWTVAGGAHATDAPGCSATLAFTGQAIGLLAPRGPGYGWAQIYLDGVLVGTVNLSSPTPVGARVVWQRALGAVGAHTVRVRTLGTVGHPGVAIDGFAVLR